MTGLRTLPEIAPSTDKVDWAALRQQYPGALANVYLDTATKGIPAPETIERVTALCDFVRDCPGRSVTEDAIELLNVTDEARTQVAALIGARPSEIAMMPTTQHGLLAVLGAMRLREGDVVVTDDMEFLGATVPLQMLRRSRGIEVRVVRHRNGEIPLDGMAAALHGRVRAVVVSSIQEVNGSGVDLAALAELCHARGALLIVDAIQHAGAAPLDVEASGVDCVACGAQKWLAAPFGCGFLYVREEALAELECELPGYMALRPPDEGWDALLAARDDPESERYELLETAQRLETGGSPNAVGAAALATAIASLRAIGLDAVYARVRELNALTAERLRAIDGAVVTGPPDAEHAAGIVSFSTGRGVNADRVLMEHLADHGVRVSLRGTAGAGGIRVSPFIYNDFDDVERFAEAVSSGLARLTGVPGS